jgi:hypothetical protein
MNGMMLGLGMAAALGLAVTASARTPPMTSSQSSMAPHENDVKVTGCLERGAAGSFILTNAKMEPSSEKGYGSSATGTTGTSGTTAAGAAKGTSPESRSTWANDKTWKLEGGTNLAKHVGHTVAVQGTASMNGTAAGTTGTTGSMGSGSMNMRELQVKSVKTISTTCTR